MLVTKRVLQLASHSCTELLINIDVIERISVIETSLFLTSEGGYSVEKQSRDVVSGLKFVVSVEVAYDDLVGSVLAVVVARDAGAGSNECGAG